MTPVWLIIIGVVAIVISDLLSKPKCPACRRRRMKWLDQHVDYYPGPSNRKLFRCPSCRAEFAQFEKKLIPRSEWKNPNDVHWNN